MSYSGGCPDCVPGRYCDSCRARARAAQRRSRVRNGYRRPHPVCFRCLNQHPRGEQACPLAAEYESVRESDTGWTYPEPA